MTLDVKLLENYPPLKMLEDLPVADDYDRHLILSCQKPFLMRLRVAIVTLSMTSQTYEHSECYTNVRW